MMEPNDIITISCISSDSYNYINLTTVCFIANGLNNSHAYAEILMHCSHWEKTVL